MNDNYLFGPQLRFPQNQNSIGSTQECESRLGRAAKQKQEDLDHLSRLLDGLQLDKDILTQLKVRENTFLSGTILLFKVNLQAKVARKLAGKKR